MTVLWLLGGALLVTAGLLEGWPRLTHWWAGRQAERGARGYLKRRMSDLRKAQQEKQDPHRW